MLKATSVPKTPAASPRTGGGRSSARAARAERPSAPVHTQSTIPNPHKPVLCQSARYPLWKNAHVVVTW